MSDILSTEVERIRRAYNERDAWSSGGWSWGHRGYRLYMQDLEWQLLEALTAQGLEPAGRRVLEVGCGSGYYLARFLDYGAAVAAGIDLIEHRAEQARNRNPRLEVVVGDAAHLPWADGSFDIVTQYTCLSSVLDGELRTRIAAEMWRVAAPGGACVSYDMTRTPPPLRLLSRYASRRARRAPQEGPITPTAPVDASELRRLFPEGHHRHLRAGMSIELADRLARVPGLGGVAALRPLRTHLLAVICKPSAPTQR
jgi:SAM-dependent methyltransferase